MIDQQSQNLLPEPEASESRWRRVGRALWLALKILPYFLFSLAVMALLGLILAGLTLAPYYESLRIAYQESRSGQARLSAAEADIANKEFAAASAELRSAAANFQTAKDNLKIVKRSPIFISVYARNQLSVADDLLDIGVRMSDSLSRLSTIGEEILVILRAEHLSFADVSAAKKGQILSVVNASVEELYNIRKEFDTVGEEMKDIAKRRPLFVFDSAISPLQQKLPKLEKAFNGLVTAAELAPMFAGYPQEKTYLLILQNNRELRPSGGFIGTYGIIKVKNGELSKFFTDDVYNLDKLSKPYLRVEPPAPIKKYLRQDQWFMRDANWWPDFPASAEKVMWFYSEEGGAEKLDGVISLTPTVLEELLGVLGEIEVAGLKFNKENFWEQLEYQVEHGYYRQGIEEAERKDIVGELGKKIIAKLYSLPMNQWLSLFDLAERLAQEKQVLMYSVEPKYEQLIAAQNWSGEVKDFGGDYFMVVDANMASLKTDEVMERTVYYTLNQDIDGGLLSEIKVNYQNLGQGHTWKTSRYQNYTRLYVPKGSQLLSVRVGRDILPLTEVDVYEEFGKTAWGTFAVIEPAQSKEVVWQYRLPQSVVDSLKTNDYQLLFQKQPGLPSVNLQLNLNFSGRGQVLHTETTTKDQIFNVWLEDSVSNEQ